MTTVSISSSSENSGGTDVTLDIASIKIAGADLRVVPEITVKGLQRQMQQMEAELRAGMLGLTPNEFADRWSLVFARVAAWEERGTKSSPDQAEAFKLFAAEEAAGCADLKKNTKFVGAMSQRFMVDRQTIKRWIGKWREWRD